MLSTVIQKVSRLQAEDIITDPQTQAMKHKPIEVVPCFSRPKTPLS